VFLFRSPRQHRPRWLSCHRKLPSRLLPLLATTLLLAGCDRALKPPTVLYLASGVDADQRIDTELREVFQERLGLVLKGFRRLHPGTSVQMAIYPEELLLQAISRRSRAGLEPDLMLIDGDTALKLRHAGLVDPFPASPDLLRSFDPALLDRVRDANGRLAGLPVLLHAQLSCYDRRRLREAPRTLEDLLKRSSSDQAVGLSVDPFNLLWTAGSLGAMPALDKAASGRAIAQSDREAIERWLRWLQLSSAQQRITFFASQPETDAELMAGRVAWIPCRSMSLPMLRRHLGTRLGVAPLPDGPNQQRAAPVNRLRVLALGRHSSAIGRARALDFVRYSVNPLTQRTMTTGSLTVLPANRFVTLPMQGSAVLNAMAVAQEQGQQVNVLVALLRNTDTPLTGIQGLLTQLVFGEASPAASTEKLVRILQRQG